MTRTRPRYGIGAVALVALSAATAMIPMIPAWSAAQSPPPRTGAALPERLAPATRATIERLADSLASERLPAYALRDKAAEGALKGADDARILQAVSSLAGRLRESRGLLGGAARDDELIASASALYAGVPSRGIARLVDAQRRRGTSGSASLGVPLMVLAELASSRVPPDLAIASVDALLAKGARDVDFGAFRLSVERDIRQGRSPKDAVSTGMQSTLRGIGRTPNE